LFIEHRLVVKLSRSRTQTYSPNVGSIKVNVGQVLYCFNDVLFDFVDFGANTKHDVYCTSADKIKLSS
jgi:hypothetical protein